MRRADRLLRRNRCANIAVLALSVHTTCGIRIPYVKLIRTTALSGAYLIGDSYSTQMSNEMLVSIFQMDIFIGHRPNANAKGMDKRS